MNDYKKREMNKNLVVMLEHAEVLAHIVQKHPEMQQQLDEQLAVIETYKKKIAMNQTTQKENWAYSLPKII